MKSLLSRHFWELPSVHLIEGVRLKEVSLLYTRYIKRLCDVGHGKVSAVNI